MKKIILFVIAIMLSVSSIAATVAQTRYLKLTITDNNVLLVNDKQFSKNVEGEGNLSFINTYQLENTDVTIIQDTGGTACPALFYMVVTNKSSAVVSPKFGTCTDLITVINSPNDITVTMKKGKKKLLYNYKDGVFTFEGKVFKY